MKVKELLDILKDVDPEAEIILQKDSEGNGYSPLADADPDAVYIPDSTYSGTAYSLKWTADEALLTEEEWAEMKSRTRCVVLCPVN